MEQRKLFHYDLSVDGESVQRGPSGQVFLLGEVAAAQSSSAEQQTRS